MQEPTNLVQLIRAALDDTERIARDLTMDDSGIWSMQRVGRVVDQYGREIAECTELGRVEASHIAHNDPAAVLRRVAADREILAEHPPGTRLSYNNSDGYHYPGVYCRTCGPSEPAEVGQRYPCPTVRALARGLGINPEGT